MSGRSKHFVLCKPSMSTLECWSSRCLPTSILIKLTAATLEPAERLSQCEVHAQSSEKRDTGIFASKLHPTSFAKRSLRLKETVSRCHASQAHVLNYISGCHGRLGVITGHSYPRQTATQSNERSVYIAAAAAVAAPEKEQQTAKQPRKQSSRPLNASEYRGDVTAQNTGMAVTWLGTSSGAPYARVKYCTHIR